MIKVIIKMEGRVQGVGLRAVIKDIADGLGVCGTVENKRDGSVHIVCEAEQPAINEMIRRIKSEPAPVVIEKITSGEPSAVTGMSAFKIIAEDSNTEMYTAIYAGVHELRTVNKTLLHMNGTLLDIKDTQHEIKDTLHEIKDTQDEIKGTQDEIKDTLHEIKDTQDEIKGTQDEMNTTLKSVDRKMDLSLNNDAEMLEILRSMHDGGLLRVPK